MASGFSIALIFFYVIFMLGFIAAMVFMVLAFWRGMGGLMNQSQNQ